MDNSKSIKFNLNKLLLKAISIVVIGAFLLTTVFRDLAWAFPSEQASSLRATAAGKEWVAEELEKELQEDPEARLSRLDGLEVSEEIKGKESAERKQNVETEESETENLKTLGKMPATQIEPELLEKIKKFIEIKCRTKSERSKEELYVKFVNLLLEIKENPDFYPGNAPSWETSGWAFFNEILHSWIWSFSMNRKAIFKAKLRELDESEDVDILVDLCNGCSDLFNQIGKEKIAERIKEMKDNGALDDLMGMHYLFSLRTVSNAQEFIERLKRGFYNLRIELPGFLGLSEEERRKLDEKLKEIVGPDKYEKLKSFGLLGTYLRALRWMNYKKAKELLEREKYKGNLKNIAVDFTKGRFGKIMTVESMNENDKKVLEKILDKNGGKATFLVHLKSLSPDMKGTFNMIFRSEKVREYKRYLKKVKYRFINSEEPIFVFAEETIDGRILLNIEEIASLDIKAPVIVIPTREYNPEPIIHSQGKFYGWEGLNPILKKVKEVTVGGETLKIVPGEGCFITVYNKLKERGINAVVAKDLSFPYSVIPEESKYSEKHRKRLFGVNKFLIFMFFNLIIPETGSKRKDSLEERKRRALEGITEWIKKKNEEMDEYERTVRENLGEEFFGLEDVMRMQKDADIFMRISGKIILAPILKLLQVPILKFMMYFLKRHCKQKEIAELTDTAQLKRIEKQAWRYRIMVLWHMAYLPGIIMLNLEFVGGVAFHVISFSSLVFGLYMLSTGTIKWGMAVLRLKKLKADSFIFQTSMARLREKGKYGDKIKGLREVLENRAAAGKPLTSKSIILYAEEVLKNGAVDLPEVLELLLKNQVLDKIILYAEDPVYNEILKKLIEETAPELKITTKTNEELGLKDSATEVEEIETLIGEEKNILCVIKGIAEDQEALSNLSNKQGIPIVVFKGAGGKHIYSLADALQSALTAREMFIDLPPVETGDIEEEYKEYRESLRELSGA